MLSLVSQLNDVLPLPRINFGKIWSFFKVTGKPRFAYALAIRDKNGDPREPEWLGTVYNDQQTDKKYLVVSKLYEKDGEKHKDLISIKEVVSFASLSPKMTREELGKIDLIPAAVDVENDMMDYFRGVCAESGRVFHDLRERKHGTGSKEPASSSPSLN